MTESGRRIILTAFPKSITSGQVLVPQSLYAFGADAAARVRSRRNLMLEGYDDEKKRGRKLFVKESRQKLCAVDEQVRKIHGQACCFFGARGLDHMQAQDLATETCLRWLVQTQERPAAFAWIQMVEQNLLIDHLRRQQCQKRLLESYAIHVQCRAEEGRLNDSVRHMVDRLGDLSSSDRQILVDYYLNDVPIRELAQGLGSSINCAKQRLCRARPRLRQLVGLAAKS
jgi:RNA polymerase sigma factor (sigma-70 family)